MSAEHSILPRGQEPAAPSGVWSAFDPTRSYRRPLAVELSSKLLASHRGSAPLALGADAVGRVFTLRDKAPTTTLHAATGALLPLGSAPAQTGTAVAVVAIDGPLSQREEDTFCGLFQGYDGIASRLSAALEDPQVGAVVLRVNSPGGDVAGLAEGVRVMRAAIERSGKPVLAHADEMAASAAVYLACGLATDGIYMPESGLFGSIGTIASLWSEHRAMDAVGVDCELVCDPPGKSAGWSQQPISDKARERTTALVKACSAEFIAHVASARGLSAAAVRGLDARMLRGSEAVDAGLVDGIAGLGETIAKAGALAQKRANAPRQQTTAGRTLANGRQHMDQGFIAAKIGLGADATETQINERLGALAALEGDVTRIGGDPNARKALGAIEALVATGRAAKEIEAKATAARVDSMLLTARQSKGLTLAEAESLKAKGATDPDWLEGHLASMSSRLPPAHVEPEAESVLAGAAPVKGEPEKHDGKTYAEMTFSERANLQSADKAKFSRMKSAHDAQKKG